MTHSPVSVRIDGGAVVVVCLCGWESSVLDSESACMIEYELHAKEGE